MAELSIEAGLDRVVAWAPHTGRIHGFYRSVPVDGPSPLAFFTMAFRRFEGTGDVIVVAPDAGVSNYQPCPEEVEVSEIMGDFEGSGSPLSWMT